MWTGFGGLRLLRLPTLRSKTERELPWGWVVRSSQTMELSREENRPTTPAVMPLPRSEDGGGEATNPSGTFAPPRDGVLPVSYLRPWA